MAYTDPRPGLPLSPLMQRALDGALRDTALSPKAEHRLEEIRAKVTKLVTKKAVTIIQDVTKKRGRPNTGNAKTAAERKRAQRAKKTRIVP